jgi:hypothetical protein
MNALEKADALTDEAICDPDCCGFTIVAAI